MCAYNFERSGRNFTNFFCSTPKIFFRQRSLNFLYLHRFQKYLRSNLKVVENRTDFCMFFLSKIIMEAVPPTVVLALTHELRRSSSAKVFLGYTP